MGRGGRRPLRPERLHTAVGLGTALLVALGLFLLFRPPRSAAHALAAWLAAINLTALLYYGYDKAQARAGGRRVPEAVLHLLALVGGSPGAWLGMRLFRHKTVKGSFRFLFWCIVAVQLTLCVGLAWRLWAIST